MIDHLFATISGGSSFEEGCTGYFACWKLFLNPLALEKGSTPDGYPSSFCLINSMEVTLTLNSSLLPCPQQCMTGYCSFLSVCVLANLLKNDVTHLYSTLVSGLSTYQGAVHHIFIFQGHWEDSCPIE